MRLKRRLSVRGLREALHDDIGPGLFFVATRVKLLGEELTGKKRRQAVEVEAELERLRERVRGLERGEDEAEVIDLGSALAGLARKVKGRFHNGLDRPIKEAKMAGLLFRIAREAAHNAARHGGGDKVVIRLSPGVLEVEDNGSGLRKGWRNGMGMKLMKRRARKLGGKVTLQNVAGRGTVLTCHFS